MPVFTTRPIIMGTRGVVTSGHYLATAAGFRIMEQGGNAIFVLFAKAELRTKLIFLHCFQKKSTRGIKTPKKEIDLIKRRLKIAQELAQEKEE